MSEYQYYEFRAVDQALTDRQMATLRSFSTRAEITPWSFVNVYNFGDFRGKPELWVEKYFDAFVYMANWGTRELMFRIPRSLVDEKVIKQFCQSDFSTCWRKGEFFLFHFISEMEEGSDWEEGEGWLERLLPLREDIANGDYRALYLGWLSCLLNDPEFRPKSPPPAPAGLKQLSPPLKALVAFLRLDRRLVAAAAKSSVALEKTKTTKTSLRMSSLSEKEKTSWLRRFLSEEPSVVRRELLRRFESPEGPKRLQLSQGTDVQALIKVRDAIWESPGGR